MRCRCRLLLLALAAGLTAPAAGRVGLRVAAWNISNYDGTGTRDPSFKTAIYGMYQGRSMAPDIFLAQEISDATGAGAFLAILNAAPGSPGDWAMADFTPGPDTNLAFYYRTSRAAYLGQTLVLAGGNPSGAPRDIRRYDIRLAGYSSPGATLAVYGDHMKSGSATADQDRRLIEATAIRNDANALPSGWQFVVAGDFNIQSASQAAYQQLIGSLANNRGRSIDPISTPGSWNGTMGFRFVHTQAPGGNPTQTGGMDDRFDFILLCTTLANGDGFDYIGNAALPYSTTTWNDPNHSFRAWGEDGTYFNSTITINTNAMVGPTIAAAIKATCDTDTAGGHLPVFLDLRVPPKVVSPAVVDFGTVAVNAPAEQAVTIGNGGNVTLWTTTGIAPLAYSLAASPGFGAPTGTFTAGPGTPGNQHTITMSTATPGPVSGTLTISSNDPDQPVRLVTLVGNVVGTCYANCDGSTTAPVLNVNDFACFIGAFAAADPYANCDGSTSVPVLNVNDFACFIGAFAAGCP